MNKLLAVAAGLLLMSAGITTEAAGPIDGEIGAVYWNSEFDSTGAAALASDSGSPGFRASLWLFNHYGIKAGVYKTDLDDFTSIESSSYTSLDFMWRPLSPTQNNYLAFGVGWQEMDLNSIGLAGSTSGARVNVEGRVGLGKIFFAYGEGSYLPSLDDAAATLPALGQFQDLSGMEYEIGVSVKPAPFLNLRAGYRSHSVDFNQTGIDPLLGLGTSMKGTAESTGFLAGLIFNF